MTASSVQPVPRAAPAVLTAETFDGIPCSQLGPFYWSPQDTDKSIVQAKVWNQKLITACPQYAPATDKK